MMTTGVDRMQDEFNRTAQRVSRGIELAIDQSEAQVGQTPREVVGRRGKARLYYYRAVGESATPIYFVPYLGISRTYVFDLQPGASFVEFMTNQGFDFYLLDWGDLGPEDSDFSLEDAVLDVIPAMLRRTLRHSGADEVNLFGYCMGVPMTMAYMGIHPDAPVRTLVMAVGPVDFRHGGSFGLWTAKENFPVDKLIDTFDNAPLEYVQLGFKLLQPTNDAASAVNLWWNLWNEQYVDGYRAMNRWSNEWVGFPGEFFRQWIKWFYQENRLHEGALALRGRTVDLSKVTQPLLVAAARQDKIVPPAAAKALMDLVGSKDKEYIELPGGHISLIAGRQAHQNLWPKVAAWLKERDAEKAGKKKRGE
jgi:polyhydroxyalkanoate synthase subunit PhaC